MPLAELGASFLFQVTADRAERAAVLLTTNLPVSEWTQVIPNARLCKSLLGRCVLVRIHSSDLTLPVRTQPGSRLRAVVPSVAWSVLLNGVSFLSASVMSA